MGDRVPLSNGSRNGWWLGLRERKRERERGGGGGRAARWVGEEK